MGSFERRIIAYMRRRSRVLPFFYLLSAEEATSISTGRADRAWQALQTQVSNVFSLISGLLVGASPRRHSAPKDAKRAHYTKRNEVRYNIVQRR
jgi:hypothetical protein